MKPDNERQDSATRLTGFDPARYTLDFKAGPPTESPAPPVPDSGPNYLDILKDSADYVAFHIECDIISGGPLNELLGMSQKKCRFCS